MVAKKKPSAAQLAARAKFVKMVRAKAAAKKKAEVMPIFNPYMPDVEYSKRLKVAAKKAAAKKVAGLDRVTRKGKKTSVYYTRLSGVKKAAPKKASMDKDTKSHNVNIRVVSGIESIKKDLQKKLFDSQKFASTLVGNIDWYKQMIKLDKSKAKYWKVKAMLENKKLVELKKNIALLKKAVK